MIQARLKSFKRAGFLLVYVWRIPNGMPLCIWYLVFTERKSLRDCFRNNLELSVLSEIMVHPLCIPVGNCARLNDKVLMPSIPSGCTIIEFLIIL
jgi:hypothetical protein